MRRDYIARVKRSLGDPIEINLDQIAFDSRWEIGEPSETEINKAIAESPWLPITVRKIDKEYVCVSPAERLSALKVAEKRDLAPSKVTVFVMDDMTDSEADVMREIALWGSQDKFNDSWRSQISKYHDILVKYSGRPWLRTAGIYLFEAAIFGESCMNLYRWMDIQNKCIPEFRQLVDSGRVGVRTAGEVARKLNSEEQKGLVEQILSNKKLNTREASSLANKAITAKYFDYSKAILSVRELADKIEDSPDELTVSEIKRLKIELDRIQDSLKALVE